MQLNWQAKRLSSPAPREVARRSLEIENPSHIDSYRNGVPYSKARKILSPSRQAAKDWMANSVHFALPIQLDPPIYLPRLFTS